MPIEKDASPETFAPLLDDEANHALTLFRDELVREIYSRDDGKGAILVLEANDFDMPNQLFQDYRLQKQVYWILIFMVLNHIEVLFKILNRLFK